MLRIINYLEAYSNDNAAGKASGFKQLVAGGGIVKTEANEKNEKSAEKAAKSKSNE